jgi:hypothetical protein
MPIKLSGYNFKSLLNLQLFELDQGMCSILDATNIIHDAEGFQTIAVKC